MTAPNLSTCSPWATSDDLCGPCLTGYDSLDPQLLDRMLQVASDLLFEQTAHRFPGLCTAVFRPCGSHVYYDPPLTSSYFSSNLLFSCGCSLPTSCGCPRPSEISLGVSPIVEVTEVKVDGDVVDPSLYRVDNFTTLVRLRDPDGSYATWPCCPDVLLPDTEPGTFSVSVVYGNAPPLAGVHAAAVLACELYQSCSPIDGSECRLPRNTQSLIRQGVSMVLLDPAEILRLGKWGIPEIDNFVSTYNPNGLRRPAAVFSPDLLPSPRRTDTGSASGGSSGGGGYGS